MFSSTKTIIVWMSTIFQLNYSNHINTQWRTENKRTVFVQEPTKTTQPCISVIQFFSHLKNNNYKIVQNGIAVALIQHNAKNICISINTFFIIRYSLSQHIAYNICLAFKQSAKTITSVRPRFEPGPLSVPRQTFYRYTRFADDYWTKEMTYLWVHWYNVYLLWKS